MSHGAKLSAFLANRADVEFDWDNYNCGIFACEWVQCVTGIEIKCPRNFANLKEAYKFVKERGGYAHLIARLVEVNGFHYVDEPETGDLVVARDETFDYVIGIVINKKMSAFMQHGVVILKNQPENRYIRLCLPS